jgi:ABC-type amino acid transport system permease subunit
VNNTVKEVSLASAVWNAPALKNITSTTIRITGSMPEIVRMISLGFLIIRLSTIKITRACRMIG